MRSRNFLTLFALLAIAALFAVGTITAAVAQDADADFGDVQPVVADESGSLQGAVAAASGGDDAPADPGADPPVPAVDSAADAAGEETPDESGKVVVGEAEIDAQVHAAVAAQERRDEVEHAAPAQLIASEAAAVLASGDGDVATTGACAREFDLFCATSMPGLGRFAQCLSSRLGEEANGNVEGQLVSDQCKDELRDFKRDRGTNINKDITLAKACKRDARRFCKNVNAKKDLGATLACLRKVYPKLATRCQAEVSRSMQDGAEDFEADAMLGSYCKKDADKLCSDVPPGAGRVQACLNSLRLQDGLVSFECLSELFRQEVENAQDIRLSIVLLRECMGEKRDFCALVAPGHADTFECLEHSRNLPDFGQRCRAEVETVMERRSHDFRLNPKLAHACQEDIHLTCGVQLERMDYVAGVDGKVLNCLQDHRDELKAAECTQEVHKNMVRRSEDIRFNYPLAFACREDRPRVCATEQPGSARIIGCFQRNREQLGFECKAALFDQEQQMAEDIDFLVPLKRACAMEILHLCDDAPQGHGRIQHCLQEDLDALGPQCRAEMDAQTQRQATDYRLNYRLKTACERDVAQLCAAACANATTQACGGKALRCLTERVEDIQSDACTKEVLYFEQMEVYDFRNDVLLAEACRSDVGKFCKKVEPGEGRVVACLRQHRPKLQAECRKEELQLSLLAASDVRLRPKLRKLCSEEMAVYCAGVKPGRGRMMRCLQENLWQPQFGQGCLQQVAVRGEAMQADFREDVSLAATCAPEIDSLCKAEQGRAHGQSQVLKCLVRGQAREALGADCDEEVSRAARMALWDYRPGAALTSCCDGDVEGHCQLRQHRRGVYSIGHVGKCLARQLASGGGLASECKQLVLAAAPLDSRALVNAKSAQAMLKDKMKEAQQSIRAAALASPALARAKMVDREAHGASIITLTGWLASAAVVAMALVVLMGAFVALRRLLGPRRQAYTVLVPRDGDA